MNGTTPQSIFDPGHPIYGGGATHTVLHPLVIGLMIAIAVLVFTLPRRYVIMPLVFGILGIPYGQVLYIGMHIYMAPLLLVVGWGRLLASQAGSEEDLLPGGLTKLDKVFLLWALYRFIAVILLFRQAGVIPNQIDFLWDAVGGYFLFRCLLRDDEDVVRALKAVVVVAVICAAGMLYEHQHDHNYFAFLGNVRPIPEMRHGRIRAQGLFGHALLAGVFGATTLPLFLWMWQRGKAWFLGIIGIVASCAITFFSSESTPVMAVIACMVVFFMWPLRKSMRMIRWGIVVGLLGLQLVMKAPFWFVVAHIDLSGGSTGWDRAELIDLFIHHFFNWFLVGTHDNINWGYDMWDQCNQFVLEGETGGLVGFWCFISMFVIGFRWIGNARKWVEGNRKQEWLYWIFGAALFDQAMAFFGIDYFDQTKYLWYLILVMISTVTLQSREAVAPLPSLNPDPEPAFGWNAARPALVSGSGGLEPYVSKPDTKIKTLWNRTVSPRSWVPALEHRRQQNRGSKYES